MRVLVCGGRDFRDPSFIFRHLTQVQSKRGITLLIHGDARGVDHLAASWAETRDIPVESYPAEWGKYGAAAGPRRNARMLIEGKPDLVVAFPGGRGTADMVRRARAAGIEVREIELAS